MAGKKVCVSDVDGVLVDPEERIRRAKELARALNRKYWEYLYDEELIKFDRPRPAGIQLLKEKSREYPIVILTGRPRKSYDVTYQEIIRLAGFKPYLVVMRNEGMRDIIKAKLAILEKLVRSGYEVMEIHDDNIDFLRRIRGRYPEIKLYYHLHDRHLILGNH